MNTRSKKMTARNMITITWRTNDIHKHAARYGVKLTDEQARSVLEYVGANYDHDLGVNQWTIIDAIDHIQGFRRRIKNEV